MRRRKARERERKTASLKRLAVTVVKFLYTPVCHCLREIFIGMIK